MQMTGIGDEWAEPCFSLIDDPHHSSDPHRLTRYVCKEPSSFYTGAVLVMPLIAVFSCFSNIVKSTVTHTDLAIDDGTGTLAPLFL